MRDLLKENMCLSETVFRLMLGIALLAVTMFDSKAAVWLALLAVYPVISAITAWDPFYAISKMIRWNTKAASQHQAASLPC